MAMSDEVKARLRDAGQKKANETILKRQPQARVLIATDYVRDRGWAESADRGLFKTRWFVGRQDRHSPIRYARVRHATADQLAALAGQLPFEWVSIGAFDHQSHTVVVRAVRVYPAAALVGVFEFMGLDTKKYLVGYTARYVTSNWVSPDRVASGSMETTEPAPYQPGGGRAD